MHLIETYSASSGLQIDKPQIYEKFFALPFESFIVLHSGGGMQSKQYEYYSEVVSLLRPILQDKNIEIVQIGARTDPYVKNTVDLRGATSIHQTAYIIRNAKLFFGNDSCNLHIASGYDIPIVGLYGSTTPYNHGPYFSSEGRAVTIVGDLRGQKPSYSPNEADKVINRIKPEEVVKAILKSLKIRKKVNRESISFGRQYSFYNLDLIPDCILGHDTLKELTPTIRMDLEFNEDYLVHNLRVRPYNVITKKPINVDILSFFKANIKSLIYEIEEGYSTEFIDRVRRAGINYILYTLLKGDELAQAKLDFFDYGVIKEGQKKGAQILEEYPNISKDTKYKTNKFLLSKDKIFLNKIRWQENKSVADFNDNIDTVSLNPEFFDYAEHFYLFNE